MLLGKFNFNRLSTWLHPNHGMTVATFHLYFKPCYLLNDVIFDFFRAELEHCTMPGTEAENISYSINPFSGRVRHYPRFCDVGYTQPPIRLRSLRQVSYKGASYSDRHRCDDAQ